MWAIAELMWWGSRKVHHMAILTRSGLVEAVKQGQWRWYRRNEPAIRSLLKTLRTKL